MLLKVSVFVHDNNKRSKTMKNVLVQRYQRADYHVVVGFGLAFNA